MPPHPAIEDRPKIGLFYSFFRVRLPKAGTAYNQTRILDGIATSTDWYATEGCLPCQADRIVTGRARTQDRITLDANCLLIVLYLTRRLIHLSLAVALVIVAIPIHACGPDA